MGAGGTAYLNALELDDGYHTKVESPRDLVELFDREVAMLERQIHQRLHDDAGYRAIQAIDGAGRVLAAIFVAERRHRSLLFPRRAELVGGTDAQAQRAGPPSRPSRRCVAGPKLRADYHRIGARRGVRIARVAVARKLLTLVYFGLCDGEIRCLARADEAA